MPSRSTSRRRRGVAGSSQSSVDRPGVDDAAHGVLDAGPLGRPRRAGRCRAGWRRRRGCAPCPSIAGGSGSRATSRCRTTGVWRWLARNVGGRYSSSHGTLSSAGAAPSDSVRRRPRPAIAAAVAGRVVAVGDVAGEQRARRGRRRAPRRRRPVAASRRRHASRWQATASSCPATREDRPLQLGVVERQAERAVVLDAVGPDPDHVVAAVAAASP